VQVFTIQRILWRSQLNYWIRSTRLSVLILSQVITLKDSRPCYLSHQSQVHRLSLQSCSKQDITLRTQHWMWWVGLPLEPQDLSTNLNFVKQVATPLLGRVSESTPTLNRWLHLWWMPLLHLLPHLRTPLRLLARYSIRKLLEISQSHPQKLLTTNQY
jgi:hypothetical protein